MSRAATAAAWRARLDGALDASHAPTAEQGRPGVDWVGPSVAAARCPARALVSVEPFSETAATAARALALTTLRSGPGTGSADGVRQAVSPAEQVRAVMEEPSVLRPGLAGWLRGLDRAGRAAAVAAATRWMVDAVALADGRGAPHWQDPAGLRYQPRNREVVLSAAVDATRDRGDGVHLLIVRLRHDPTDGRLSRRIALVWALVRGQEPRSVVVAHRESLGRDRHAVDHEVLEASVADAVDDIRWASRPSTAPTVTGPGCRHCHLLDDCDPGRRHLEALPGSPFPAWVGVSGPSGSGQSGDGADPTM